MRTVKQFLATTQSDWDIEDKIFDEVVTCCFNEDEPTDNYDRFCDALYSKVTMVNEGDWPVADWSGFVTKNFEKFKEFSNKYWNDSYDDDEEEFVYQWVTEFHGFLAGYTTERIYGILADLINKMEMVTE